ncbi:MAG: hypothetical protein JWQ20_1339 [Conexibacter sp.]|nr:hypothetical protein [Conexibacter sp.]
MKPGLGLKALPVGAELEVQRQRSQRCVGEELAHKVRAQAEDVGGELVELLVADLGVRVVGHGRARLLVPDTKMLMNPVAALLAAGSSPAGL